VVVAASIVTAAARRWLGRTRWTDVCGRAPCRRTRHRRTAGGGTRVGEALRGPGARTRATRSSNFGGEGVRGRAQEGRGRLFNVGSIVAGPCSREITAHHCRKAIGKRRTVTVTHTTQTC
jgi:hypothetical protein